VKIGLFRHIISASQDESEVENTYTLRRSEDLYGRPVSKRWLPDVFLLLLGRRLSLASRHVCGGQRLKWLDENRFPAGLHLAR
jgi:hypothetical protein